jgi:hypothetical protein
VNKNLIRQHFSIGNFRVATVPDVVYKNRNEIHAGDEEMQR